MNYNLDKPLTRSATNSYKWDYNKTKFGREDVIPFWVADMDFACAPPIIEAIQQRAQHPVFGYTIRGPEYYSAVIDWLSKRFNWNIEAEWLKFCPPGAIQAINALVLLLSEEGDEVIVQTPAYAPLLDVVTANNRKVLKNQLRYEDRRYELDFEDLKSKISEKTKLLLLCSPHNPTGRVWTHDELNTLSEICQQNDIIVISDEVHSDLIFKGNKHFPMGSVSKKFQDNSVTVISPSKSFNTAALPQSSLIIPSAEIRDKFQRYLDVAQLNLDNIFASVAMIASYNDCEDWLDDVIKYVSENVKIVSEFFNDNFPAIKVIKPEGTYLLWIDMRSLDKPQQEIIDAMINVGGVALYDGTEFGESCKGFFRMNLACSKTTLQAGLQGIKKAIISLQEQ